MYKKLNMPKISVYLGIALLHILLAIIWCPPDGRWMIAMLAIESVLAGVGGYLLTEDGKHSREAINETNEENSQCNN